MNYCLQFKDMKKSSITSYFILLSTFCASQSYPCTTDTVRGTLYRAMEYGNNTIHTGYYIAPCGGIQIGRIKIVDQEDAPIWIPGRYLRRDEVDNNGKLIHKEYQQQYNVGYFTDENFKRIPRSSVYGLLVERKKAF